MEVGELFFAGMLNWRVFFMDIVCGPVQERAQEAHGASLA
jgi:hypothetical protein